MSLRRFWLGGSLLAGLALSAPAAPPPPPINPAAARLDATADGLDGPGFALIADERTDLVAAGCEEGIIRYWHKDVVMAVRAGRGSPHLLHGHRGPVLALAWHPRAGLVSAGADGKIILWDFPAGRPRATLSPGTLVRCLALSPDGTLLAAAGEDAAIHLWDLNTGKAVRAAGQPHLLKGHTDWVLCLAFSPDGKTLASGSHDGTVRLWDPAARKELLAITARPPAPNTKPPTSSEPAPAVTALAFRPDGKVLAMGNAGAQILLFTSPDGKFQRALSGHGSAVTGLAFHPTGTVLASSSKDRTLRLWNPANGQLLKALEGHTAWVQGVVFLARGTRLASVGADRTVRFWELTNPAK